MAKGYIIADLEVTNPDGYEQYRRAAPQTVSDFGGKYLVRAGEAKLLEGSGDPNRVVVLEFESYEKALEWYNYKAYQAVLPGRTNNSTGRLICVRGA